MGRKKAIHPIVYENVDSYLYISLLLIKVLKKQYKRKYSLAYGREHRKFNPLILKKCKGCGVIFTVKYSNKKRILCKKHCGKPGRKSYIRIKDARVDGEVYPIRLLEIMERDKGICHIFNKPVNKNIHYIENDYPSLDHVMPLAKGGLHTRNNIKLAHRICNSYKRDVVDYIHEEVVTNG